MVIFYLFKIREKVIKIIYYIDFGMYGENEVLLEKKEMLLVNQCVGFCVVYYSFDMRLFFFLKDRKWLVSFVLRVMFI